MKIRYILNIFDLCWFKFSLRINSQPSLTKANLYRCLNVKLCYFNFICNENSQGSCLGIKTQADQPHALHFLMKPDSSDTANCNFNILKQKEIPSFKNL